MSASASVNNWQKTPLRYVCELNPSVQFYNFSEHDELTFLPMEKIKSGFYLENTDKFSKYSSSYNVFENGDILLAKVTPCFENGNIAIATDLTGGKGFGSSELFVVRARKVLTRFLFYYFQSITFKKEGEASMTGAGGLKRVSPDLLKQHYLPTPDTNVQQTVVEYLDRETVRIDALVSEKEQMLALLEEKRAALISRAVTRGLNPNVVLKPSGLDWLGDVPEHWGVQRLKYLAQVRGGLTLGKKYSTKNLVEIPYLRVANVQDGYLKLDNVQTVEVPAEEIEGGLLEYGDVLMNEGGDIDKLGRGCVWRDEIKPCLHQNHVFSVRPNKVDPEWLALWSSTLAAKRYFEQRAKRSTNLASISGTNIKEFPVILPPKDEQKAIKQYIEITSSRLSNIRAEMLESISLLKERRSALITAAVTGQLSMEEMQA